MANSLQVAISFASDKSLSPNLRVMDEIERVDIYWQCILVSLISAKLLGGPGIEPIIFHECEIDNRYKALFELYDIKHIRIPFSFRPPSGFSDTFVASLYLLDAIKWFSERSEESDKLVLMDPDCFVNAPINLVSYFLEYVDACVYTMRYPREYYSNGQSLDGIERWILENLPNSPSTSPRWIGGEILAVTGAGSRLLVRLLSNIWNANMLAFSRGGKFLKTEEHMLTVAFANPMIMRREIGGEIVRRIWTARSYSNVNSLSAQVPVWHLPAEKHRGFKRLYEAIREVDPTQAKEILSDREILYRAFGFEGRVVEKIICQCHMSLKNIKALFKGRIGEFEGHS